MNPTPARITPSPPRRMSNSTVRTTVRTFPARHPNPNRPEPRFFRPSFSLLVNAEPVNDIETHGDMIYRAICGVVTASGGLIRHLWGVAGALGLCVSESFRVLRPSRSQGALALFEDALGSAMMDIIGGEHRGPGMASCQRQLPSKMTPRPSRLPLSTLPFL